MFVLLSPQQSKSHIYSTSSTNKIATYAPSLHSGLQLHETTLRGKENEMELHPHRRFHLKWEIFLLTWWLSKFETNAILLGVA